MATKDTETDTTHDADGGDTPRHGGEIRHLTPSPSTLDPIAAGDVTSMRVIVQVFDGLFTYPDAMPEAEPLLVDEVETNDDFTTYTFRLQEGVEFHDGRELTASDVVYSFERVAASPNSEHVGTVLNELGVAHETDGDGAYVPGSLAVTAEEKYTVRMTLSSAFHSALEILANPAFVPIPEGIVGDVPGYDGEMEYETFASESPVGTGPFVFEEWAENDSISISRNDDYHGHVPYVEGIHWKLIQPAEERYQYSMDKKTDFPWLTTAAYDPAKIDITHRDDHGRRFGTYGPMANGETAEYMRVPELSTFFYAFDPSVVPRPVRRAVAYTLNQRELAEDVFKNRSEPAYHITPPPIYPGGRDGYEDHIDEGYPYGYHEHRSEDGRAVMEDAGYGPETPYELTLTHYELESWGDICELVADQVATAHIDLTLREVDFPTLVAESRAGELDMYTIGWVTSWPAADNFLRSFYPDVAGTDDGITDLTWDGTDAAVRAKAAGEQIESNPEPTDEAREIRERAYVEIEEANWEDMVFLPAFHNHSERLMYDHVHSPPYGPMSPWRQKFNRTWKEQ
jgi:peptide/nickel transport system substrate-binding protein